MFRSHSWCMKRYRSECFRFVLIQYFPQTRYEIRSGFSIWQFGCSYLDPPSHIHLRTQYECHQKSTRLHLACTRALTSSLSRLLATNLSIVYALFLYINSIFGFVGIYDYIGRNFCQLLATSAPTQSFELSTSRKIRPSRCRSSLTNI